MTLNPLLRLLLGPLLIATLSAAVIGSVWLARLMADVRAPLGNVSALKDTALALSSEVFDRRGEKVGEFASERRYYVRLADLPAHVVQAFLSAEDKDFHSHLGVSPLAIVRAAIANIRGAGLKQGASTITQQLARLSFLDQEKSWKRKAKEALLALAIERKLTKDEILELYLNRIFLGNRSYGVEAAARNYFRKSATELSVGEAALLAGLPKSPTRYAPHRFPKRATARMALVLQRMEEDGFLAKGDAAAWAKQVVYVAPAAEDHFSKAPYFVSAVRQELARKFELETLPEHGLRIHTTLDARLQRAAEAQLAAAVAAARKQAVKPHPHKGRIEGAIFSMDPTTGAVLAMQGGRSFDESQFNRSEHARRRLGGLIVPVYVSLALERGYTPASRIGDDPMGGRRQKAEGGIPTIYDTVVRGLTLEGAPLYVALGNGSVMEHAGKLGFDFAQEDMSVALGLGEASPAQVAQAYAAFVNGGRAPVPYVIDRVEDANGKVLYRAQVDDPQQVLRPQTAYIAYNMLQHAVRHGHAAAANGISPLAGGMAAATDDLHDAWYVGVLPTVVSTVWLGAETGRARLAATVPEAATLAAKLWAAVMRAAPASYREKVTPVVPPPGLSFVRLPGAAKGARALPFTAGTEPAAGDRRF